MLDILAIGAANTDFFFCVRRLPFVDEEVDAFAVDRALGGSGANFAVNCCRLGLKAGFFGCLGRDKEGNGLLAAFLEAGVDVSNVKRVDERTGRFVTLVDEAGNKLMAAFVGAGNLLVKKMVKESVVKKAKLVHLTSLSSQNGFGALLKAKELALKNGVLVSLDPGHILAEKGLSKLRPLLDGIDLFFPNRAELEKLSGERDLEAGCKKLAGLVKTVVVTLGEDGCFVYSDGKGFFVRALKKKVVDSIGAGDAFAAGFVFGFLKKRPLRECAVLGNACAGLAVECRGARAGLSEAGLLKEIKRGE